MAETTDTVRHYPVRSDDKGAIVHSERHVGQVQLLAWSMPPLMAILINALAMGHSP